MTGPPGRIRLIRKRSGWQDAARSYKVLVDGVVVAKVKNGEERTLDVGSGQHEIYLKVDWARSPIVVVDLAPDEQATLVANTSRSGLSAFFKPSGYIELKRTS